MKDNIFSYWDYDSIEGKPMRELTTFGATVVTIGGAIISLGLAWLLMWATAAFQISSR